MTPFVFVIVLFCSFIQSVLSESDSTSIPGGKYLHYGPFTGSGTIDIKVELTSGDDFDFYVADSKTFYINKAPNYLTECPNGKNKTSISGTCAVPAEGDKEYYCLIVNNNPSASIGVDWTFSYSNSTTIIVGVVIAVAVAACIFVQVRKRRNAAAPTA